MLKSVRQLCSWLLGLTLSLLLISCGDTATPTAAPESLAPGLSVPLGAKTIVLPKEISDYLNKSAPSGSSLAKIYTFGLSEEPAQAAAVIDKLLSEAGYTLSGKPTEKAGVFSRFYKTVAGAEAVATYGSPELSLQGYKTTKLAPTVLEQYAATIRGNKTVLGVTIGTGLLKLYGIS